MSINLGGIYVTVQKGVTQAAVERAADKYFRDEGARRSDRGARALPELGVEDTGKLAVAIFPPTDGMIAIVDSERYTASEGLAKFIATKLKTTVLHWTVAGASDSGDVSRFGPDGELPLDDVEPDQVATNDGVIAYLSKQNLPHLFTSFDELPAKTTTVLGFRDVTLAAYEGGEAEEGEDDGLASSAQINAWRDEGIAEGMAIWEPIEATELRGLVCERLFTHLAPYGYSAGGQNRGLLGLATALGEVDYSRAQGLLKRLLDWQSGEPPITSSRTASTWLTFAKIALERKDLKTAELAIMRSTILGSTSRNEQLRIAADYLEAAGRKAEATAVRTAEKALYHMPKKIPGPLAKALEKTWTLVSEWFSTIPRQRVDTETIEDQASLAHCLGPVAADAANELQAEVRRRVALVAELVASPDVDTLRKNAKAIDFPMRLSTGADLGKAAQKAYDAGDHALAYALAEMALPIAPERAISTLLAAGLELGRPLKHLTTLAAAVTPLSPAAGRYAAHVAAQAKDTANAIAYLRRAKEAADEKLVSAATHADFASLTTNPDFRRIFDEPAHYEHRGSVRAREVMRLRFTWQGPYAKAAKGVEQTLAALLELAEKNLRFVRIGYAHEWSKLSSQARGRALSQLSSKKGSGFQMSSSDKELSTWLLQANRYEPLSRGEPERTQVEAWLPTDALQARDIITTMRSLAGADPYAAEADLALATSDADGKWMTMFARLHPGLDVRANDDASAVSGQCWLTILGRDFDTKGLRQQLDTRLTVEDVGGGLLILAGPTPERGDAVAPGSAPIAMRASLKQAITKD